ncbi:hypothetical protein [Tumebacillus permanentifrigoris]|uniref:Lipoprotein n=1 Tax=Tumebacillus permanentifrigoris TaxID=378543 RepID=A0A316DAX1_9BACL|nr:hypothetical protein [Tumebacillus permanentifrigoris]PWK13051.1 hypothetical protein C7459_10869 [Tumebacillus permanentifrigoris]
MYTMKKTLLALSLCLTLALTGCTSKPKPETIPLQPQQPVAHEPADQRLAPYSAMNTAFDVPNDWPTTQTGQGNWSGIDFINPADPNQKVSLVVSGCSGCAMNAEKAKTGVVEPDPFAVLPKNATDKTQADNHLTARYTLPTEPFPTYGAVLVLQDKPGADGKATYMGYATLQVTVPANQKDFADKILDSFRRP